MLNMNETTDTDQAPSSTTIDIDTRIKHEYSGSAHRHLQITGTIDNLNIRLDQYERTTNLSKIMADSNISKNSPVGDCLTKYCNMYFNKQYFESNAKLHVCSMCDQNMLVVIVPIKFGITDKSIRINISKTNEYFDNLATNEYNNVCTKYNNIKTDFDAMESKYKELIAESNTMVNNIRYLEEQVEMEKKNVSELNARIATLEGDNNVFKFALELD